MVGYWGTMVGWHHSEGLMPRMGGWRRGPRLAPGSKVGAEVQGWRRGPGSAPGSNVGAGVQCWRRGPMSAPGSNVGARPGMHTVLAELLFLSDNSYKWI